MKLMKLRLALAAVLALPLAAAAGIIMELPASLALPKAVRLADGSVLPAGPYDVQIHYKGFGNAADLWFFQKGLLKGKSPAEARGFPAQAPPGGGGATGAVGDKSTPLSPNAQKGVADVIPKVESGQKVTFAGAPASFSWEKAGFRKGQKGIVSPGPPGMLKLSFDSANSAAGVIAILPYIEQRRP